MKQLTEYDQYAVKVAFATYNNILKFHNDREDAALSTMPADGVLYHYTTPDGLKGIIEKKELWATSAYFLNDPAEITYGYNLLKDVLEGWLTESTLPADSLAVALAKDLRKSFGEDLLSRKVINPIYLACFCEEGNLLSQWRAYGQSGGYSIGFRVPRPSTISLGQGFTPEPNVYTSKWARVEYDKNEQIKQCRAVLDSILAFFAERGTTEAIRAVDDHPLVSYQCFLRVVQDILLEELVHFKHEAFRVEKEWRVIVRRRELTKQGTDDGGKTPVPVHFRTGRGMLIPYVRLIPTDPPNKTLPIQCIRTGPTLEKTTAAMALIMLLEKCGYPPI